MDARGRGRRWNDDFVLLASFLRQRGVLRIAREEQMLKAREIAADSLADACPDFHYFVMMANLVTEGEIEDAAVFYNVVIANAFVNAGLLYWFYSTHIRRPLTLDAHYSYSVPYYKWASPSAFAQMFRLPSINHLQRLAMLLRLPAEIHGVRSVNDQLQNTYRAEYVDALAVCLARLCLPGRLSDLKHRLQIDWSLGKISSIINATVLQLYNTWRGRVLFDDRVFENHHLLSQFAVAINRAGGRFHSCVGFIDGTTFHIARPGGGDLQQAVFYSGHKRCHVVRWQGVVTPDGMVASFYGPHQGASNDRGLLNVSKLDDHLRVVFGVNPAHPDTPRFFLYGDAGYDTNGLYKAVYTPADMPDHQSREAANSVRVSIENVFGLLKGEHHVCQIG